MNSEYTVIGDKSEYSIHRNGTQMMLSNKEVSYDLVPIKGQQYHMIKDKQSYTLELLHLDAKEKLISVKVNGKIFKLQLKDKYDKLLHSLGMDVMASVKVSDLKAPMPGLVLNIGVSVGHEVKKDEPIIVLEAMKMENVLKSPADGIIKSIHVKKGDAVEKNQLLLCFE